MAVKKKKRKVASLKPDLEKKRKYSVEIKRKTPIKPIVSLYISLEKMKTI
ncbi:MAG: hypothetical protein ABIL69_10095 [candidate division WOR-3 bacterium]